VEQAVFLEKSTFKPEGILDNLDALNNDNHTFAKVTLPDGSEWAVDFHGHNASNFSPKNPPIMRPYDEVRQEWKKYMGNEFMES